MKKGRVRIGWMQTTNWLINEHTSNGELNRTEQQTEKEIYIIGGAQIYKYCLDKGLIDEMLITYIHQDFEGDAFFPEFDESSWEKTMIMDYKKDEKNPHDFTVYRFLKK